MENKIQEQDIPTIFKKLDEITDFEIEDKEAADLYEIIQNRKERYFYDLSVNLNNPQTSHKTY